MGTSLLAKLTVGGAPVNARLDDGPTYGLDAFAACVIGGAPTSGGLGTAGGRLTGALLFEVLD
ncbi:hypothetical protein [Sorangium sp. So ce124]|uniref:hypothetical protein n=1 Tax=Sorangium sp. So ce124 TaxID=3133280 RepID=UPI003F60BFD3